jgi:hypothetical protein
LKASAFWHAEKSQSNLIQVVLRITHACKEVTSAFGLRIKACDSSQEFMKCLDRSTPLALKKQGESLMQTQGAIIGKKLN